MVSAKSTLFDYYLVILSYRGKSTSVPHILLQNNASDNYVARFPATDIVIGGTMAMAEKPGPLPGRWTEILVPRRLACS